MRLDLHTARPSAPSCLLPRGSRPTGEPTPARRSGARTKPGGGALRRTRTHHDPPMTTGRAEGGFRSAGPPGGAVHGPPLIPP